MLISSYTAVKLLSPRDLQLFLLISNSNHNIYTNPTPSVLVSIKCANVCEFFNTVPGRE